MVGAGPEQYRPVWLGHDAEDDLPIVASGGQQLAIGRERCRANFALQPCRPDGP